MKEYKVLTQKDRFFSGRADAAQLETALNFYAGLGWCVISIASATTAKPLWETHRDEMVIILERDRPDPKPREFVERPDTEALSEEGATELQAAIEELERTIPDEEERRRRKMALIDARIYG